MNVYKDPDFSPKNIILQEKKLKSDNIGAKFSGVSIGIRWISWYKFKVNWYGNHVVITSQKDNKRPLNHTSR